MPMRLALALLILAGCAHRPREWNPSMEEVDAISQRVVEMRKELHP